MVNEPLMSADDRAGGVPSPRSSPSGEGDGSLPEVSVVVPTHHRADLVAHTLRSILGQTVTEIEVIVVIDGADEPTARVIDSIADGRVRAVTNREPLGVSRARNTGLHHSRAPWVAFCDDDDLWAPSKLEEQLDALRSAPGSRWSATSAVLLLGDGTIGAIQNCPDATRVREGLRRENVIPGGGSGVLVDRALAIEIDGFDTELSMFADWDMWLRLAHAADVAVATAPLVAFRCHPASMSRHPSDTARELAWITEKHAARSGATRSVSVHRARTWCLDRATEGLGRRDALRTLRDLRTSHRAPVWWTMMVASRLMVPRRLRRLVRQIGRRAAQPVDVSWLRRAIADEAPPRERPDGRLLE